MGRVCGREDRYSIIERAFSIFNFRPRTQYSLVTDVLAGLVFGWRGWGGGEFVKTLPRGSVQLLAEPHV